MTDFPNFIQKCKLIKSVFRSILLNYIFFNHPQSLCKNSIQFCKWAKGAKQCTVLQSAFFGGLFYPVRHWTLLISEKNSKRESWPSTWKDLQKCAQSTVQVSLLRRLNFYDTLKIYYLKAGFIPRHSINWENLGFNFYKCSSKYAFILLCSSKERFLNGKKIDGISYCIKKAK